MNMTPKNRIASPNNSIYQFDDIPNLLNYSFNTDLSSASILNSIDNDNHTDNDNDNNNDNDNDNDSTINSSLIETTNFLNQLDDFNLSFGNSINSNLIPNENISPNFKKINDPPINSLIQHNFKKKKTIHNEGYDQLHRHFEHFSLKRNSEPIIPNSYITEISKSAITTTTTATTTNESSKQLNNFELIRSKSDNKLLVKKLFICSQCNKNFLTISNLTSHSRCHLNKEDQIPCDYCNKFFKRRNDLERHKETHHFKLKLICKGIVNNLEWGCGISYSRKDALVKHWNGKGVQCLNSFKYARNLNDNIPIKNLRKEAFDNINEFIKLMN